MKQPGPRQCPKAGKTAQAPAQVHAGLDVGSRELLLALQRDGQPAPLHTLPNTPAGHCQLLKLLTARGAPVRVCLEAMASDF